MVGLALVTLVLAAAPALPAQAFAAWTWPLRGEVITPYRNGDDPYAAGQHRGIDVAGPAGEPVVAAAPGEVRFAGTAGTSGLTVSVRTADGLDTSYLHLSSLAVAEGQRVAAGDRIGAVGTTGRRSAEAPHLHFGVRNAGSRHAYHDPLAFLPPRPLAPEPPRPAPLPAPAPVPPEPAPAPAPRHVPSARPDPRRVPARRPARVPERRPAPRGVPLRRPAPRRTPAHRRLPRAAPIGSPAAPAAHGMPAPAAHGIPAPAATRRRPRPAGEPGRPFAASGREPVANAPSRRAPSSPPTRSTGGASGPDVGWALACLGLLLAAALLAAGDDGRAAASRGRARGAALLRPLTGRG